MERSNTIIEESRKTEHRIEPKNSKEYTKLLEELSQSFASAANMAVKLYEQGKKDGLSNEEIHKDIEITLDGIINERRLRGILPAELTRSYTQVITSNSTIISETETNNQTKEETTAWKEIRHQVLDRIKKTGSSSNKLQRESKKGITHSNWRLRHSPQCIRTRSKSNYWYCSYYL